MRGVLYFTWQSSMYAKHRRKKPTNKHNYNIYVFMCICLFFKSHTLSSICLERLEILNHILMEILVS